MPNELSQTTLHKELIRILEADLGFYKRVLKISEVVEMIQLP